MHGSSGTEEKSGLSWVGKVHFAVRGKAELGKKGEVIGEMEFTERSELLRVLKDVRKPTKNPYLRDTTASLEAVEKMLEYADSLDDCLNYSPPHHLITQLPESFRAPTIDQLILSELQEKQETPRERQLSLEEQEAGLQVRKDENYIETYAESLNQVSTLTQSLLRDQSVLPVSESDSNFLTLTVYLFGSADSLPVAVQRNATIEQCIQKTISAYVRSQHQKTNPLRYSSHVAAYTLWLVEDDSQMPDKDFAVERTMRIGDLGAEALAFCEVEGFTAKEEVKAPMDGALQVVSDITQAVGLKICFEENWTVVAVSPELKLRDVLTLLERKFPGAGYFSPSEFEFRIGVQVDTQLRHAEECGLDMDLQVCSLGVKELKLHRKTYADSPSLILGDRIRRDTPTAPQPEEEVKFDPQRLYMTKAQACAYQEFEVIKTNRRGRKQKRILGIDQHRVYNMTESQAREMQKLATTGHAKASQIIRNKIEGLFKSVTHHPEILITNILGVEQDGRNLKEFTLEYKEGDESKKKRYELENSSKVTEVVAKITKLMTLASVEG